MERKLLILGAGQYGMVAKEIAVAMNCFAAIDFLDDENPVAIGTLNEYGDFAKTYTDAVVAIGKAELRVNYLRELQKAS